MAENSKIEWTDHTCNLWWGCTEVHAGCDNCYARTFANRYTGEINGGVWGVNQPRMIIGSAFSDLDKYQRKAAAEGVKKRVFVGSMMDIFEKSFPLVSRDGSPVYQAGELSNQIGLETNDIRNILFERITKKRYPNLIFLFLTKRPSNISKYVPADWYKECPENVWFGTSPVNQETADKLIPQLIQYAPGSGNRFLSCEPLIGYIDFYDAMLNSGLGSRFKSSIQWVILGGESWHKARVMEPRWAISLISQCRLAKVPVFFKQWGEWKESDDFNGEMVKVGKKEAGNTIRGNKFMELPNF